ncbi:complement C1s-1 subcomponent-like [Clarias gariepinus]|uniref:complement C1s-1 subcomponent-like n=1 Tax=Clarias gariepinus TaxID=13013 RepID=UPI00234CC2E9|nr:complement C1s-1 subcomponent-like [Clarias gariepinus]
MDLNFYLIWIFSIFINVQNCSFVFTSVMYGELQSPNYPEHYSAPLDKHWDVKVPLGYHIQLNFNYLNIKPSQHCRNDSLTISYNEKVMKFCGEEVSEKHSHPGYSPLLIPANEVNLSLLTNGVNQGPTLPVGFSAFYQATDVDECSPLSQEADTKHPCTQICLNTMGSYLCACHYGFKLAADRRTCVRVQCEPPKSIYARISPVLPIYYYGNVVTAECDIGYTIIIKEVEFSNYTLTCQSNGQWSLAHLQCQIIHCKNPPPLLNGKVLFISGAHNQYQSVIKLQCNRPYTFPAAYNLTYTCDADKEWKDDQKNLKPVDPKCLPECGRPLVGLARHKRVLGGHLAPQRAFPWHSFIENLHRGGGVVIAEKWILTAANVVMNKNQVVDPKQTKVYVGVSDIVKRSKFSPLKIKSLHIHPLYNNSDGIHYDHDIALIKLEKPILYNGEVMPLCLPPQDAEFTPGLNGWVSGFGQTARMKSSRFLRYTSLPLVDKKTCQGFVDNLTIPVALTDNMFCAGVPEGGKDACNGDGGGAFVLRKNGVFWATGIVSWGYGCGKPGTYGVYTQVSQYIDWINKTMSEN